MKKLLLPLLLCTISCASHNHAQVSPPSPAVEREIAAFKKVDCSGRNDNECDPPADDPQAFVVPPSPQQMAARTVIAGNYFIKVRERAEALDEKVEQSKVFDDRSNGKTWRDMNSTTIGPPAPTAPITKKPNATPAPATKGTTSPSTVTYIAAAISAIVVGVIYKLLRRGK